MKLKTKLNLLIERIGLCTFQLHVLTVMLGEYSKQSNDLNPLNRLIKEVEDTEAVIDWCHSHTPLRFNPKKNKFVSRGNGKWSIASGLTSNSIIGKSALEKYKKRFNFIGVGDLERIFDDLGREIANLDAKYELAQGTITAADIEQVPEMSDREKIKAYLAANPAPDSMGKFGVPQSKYRHGTYGMPKPNQWSR
ncbi:hypothetical protein WL046_24555 [Vibrio alginolyticus]|uniref:hypothetical protein n=1 Tax=Vibrio alginolyticus TaxID=663 RepID=UPI0023EC9FF6|nr:hypothetical protein [Vibrio parahaemolyticus]